MRQLAANVARTYAEAPGVTRARLDRDTFVDLFTTMIHRESNFNPRAVSSTGAGGLGQLMPATARELGVCNVFSAQENLEGAARYLTSMLDKFGSPELALAAYNAGPAAVQKYGGVPPYHETYQYIADIFNGVRRAPSAYGRVPAHMVAENTSTSTSDVSIATFLETNEPFPRKEVQCPAGRKFRQLNSVYK
jgi:soluble lytic murein transglycosylase-like protein